MGGRIRSSRIRTGVASSVQDKCVVQPPHETVQQIPENQRREPYAGPNRRD